MKVDKYRIDKFLTEANLVRVVACSIFMPYILTLILLTLLTVYIIWRKETRSRVFIHKGSGLIKAFFLIFMVTPVLYGNWIGVLVGAFIICAIVLAMYLRSVMTNMLFEEVLTLICILSVISTSCAISERYIIPLFSKSFFTYRVSAMFFYPNYFGTIIGTVIIICAYKVLTRQGSKLFYYSIAAANVVSMYLCQSMFTWVEVFLGIAVLLVILKKHRLLTVWFFAAAIGGFVIFVLNINLIPRLSDAGVTTRIRMEIWNMALEEIKKAPLFGRGFMSLFHAYKDIKLDYIVPHAHSIFLEFLLNFGIVGTSIFASYIMKYYRAVWHLCFREKKVLTNSLILAVTAAAVVHGITDVTLFWIQTLPLFLLILSGFGGYEKTNARLIYFGKVYNDFKSCA